MVEMATERLADGRYKGAAGDPGAYIRESLLDPSEYVVAGWGQKGSNDSVSPMPAIDKAPIQLSAVEIDAVIAYLQAKDGNEVTVTLPTEAPTPAPQEASAAPASAKTPEEAIAKYGCQACHSMLGTESLVGPPLTDAGARLSKEQIIQSILEPEAEIAEGFPMGVMPGDFAEKMTVKELEMIVGLLGSGR